MGAQPASSMGESIGGRNEDELGSGLKRNKGVVRKDAQLGVGSEMYY
jgi:hypothetical protein